MRMERLQIGQDSCVLVRGDGQYHLELLSAGKTAFLEGILSSDNLRDLVRILSQDRLFQLQQKDIHSPLLETGKDGLMLSVLRPNYSWQSLIFPSAESRYPFRDTLDPLLQWFDRIEKEKGRKLSEEEGRNSCQVPGEIRLKQRPAKKAPDAVTGQGVPGEQPPSPPTYLFRLFTSQMDNGRVENTCLIVFASGTYHGVRQSENIRSKEMKTAVLDGNFPEDDLHAVHAIIDNEELQKYASSLTTDRFIGDFTLTRLTIPRNGKTQQITAWKFSNTAGWSGARMMGANERGTKTLKPLMDWLKARLPQSKEVNSSDPPNPKCLPAP